MTETNSNDAQSFLTIGEVADMRGVSRRTVERWISRGLLPALKLPPGGQVRIKSSDAEALLEPVGAMNSAAGSRGEAGGSGSTSPVAVLPDPGGDGGSSVSAG